MPRELVIGETLTDVCHICIHLGVKEDHEDTDQRLKECDQSIQVSPWLLFFYTREEFLEIRVLVKESLELKDRSFLECFALDVFLFNYLEDLSVYQVFMYDFELLWADHRYSLLFEIFNHQWLKFLKFDILKLITIFSLKRRILFYVILEII